MKKRTNKYDIEGLPLSQKTRDGLKENSLIDGLKAISILLDTQDEVYDKEFAIIKDLLKEQARTVNALLLTVSQLKDNVHELKESIEEVNGQIKELTGIVNHTRDDVEQLKKEVAELKRKNNIKNIILRIIITILSTLGIIRMWHGPF